MVRWLLESKNIDKFKLACCDWLANRQTIPVAEFSESCPPYDHLVSTATIPCYFAFSWTNQYRTSLLFVTYRPLFPHSMWLVNERSDKYGHCQVSKSSTSIKTGKSVVFGYASFGFNMLSMIWLVFNNLLIVCIVVLLAESIMQSGSHKSINLLHIYSLVIMKGKNIRLSTQL